jgi:hypothetical protein
MRETYGQTITGWTDNDPLNATWWHRVTEGMIPSEIYILTVTKFSSFFTAMEANHTLVTVSHSSEDYPLLTQ